MAVVACKICSKEFYAKPSWLKNGAGLYCSKNCQNLGRKKGKRVACFLCGKEVYKQVKALNTSARLFCSRKCSVFWHNAEFVEQKHGNWKQGSFAYKRILERSNTPACCALCGNSDREILLVHHIDKNRKNNTLKNLVWLCHNCHHLVHCYADVEKELADTLKKHATHKKV